MDLAGVGGRDVCAGTLPWVSPLWCPCPTRQEKKSKADTSVAFVSHCPGEGSWPTCITHPWLLSRLQLSCSRLWAMLLPAQINCRDVLVWHEPWFCIFRRGIAK